MNRSSFTSCNNDYLSEFPAALLCLITRVCTLQWITLPRFLFALFCLLIPANSQVSISAEINWDNKRQGAFILSILEDIDGNLWVGTEGQGAWKLNRNSKEWMQFTTNNGLGDNNIYALAVDLKGRIWAGHQYSGVSVYNGQSWKNYGIIEGPIGERVYDIQVNHKGGDVWVATSAGLSRYSIEKDDWIHYTNNDFQAADKISSIAFDKDGNIYLATQCEGLAQGQARNNYKTWQIVNNNNILPLTPRGVGLPSNLLNDVIAGTNGTIYSATTNGLAITQSTNLNDMTFVRGRDYSSKIKQLYGGPPANWNEETVEKECGAPVLSEDYVTCIAEDDNKTLWIGHRTKGLEAIETSTYKITFSYSENENKEYPRDYVRCIIKRKDNSIVAGWYGGGIATIMPANKTSDNNQSEIKLLNSPLEHPKPSRPPSIHDFNEMLRELSNVPMLPTEKRKCLVVEAPDDWMTKGDWIGRYGLWWARLCAMISPRDIDWSAGIQPVDYAAQIGPNHNNNDGLRYWVHWLFTDEPNSLELPPNLLQGSIKLGQTSAKKTRRQSEHDDHGETYPMTMDGPDIYNSIRIPKGVFYLSIYNFNKDGHDGNNRFRDYYLSVRQRISKKPFPVIDYSEFNKSPELAHSRMVDFWGGCYKRFVVKGPIELWIQLKRNHSFNTIQAGLFVDPVFDFTPNNYCSEVEWLSHLRQEDNEQTQILLNQSIYLSKCIECNDAHEAANRIFETLKYTRLYNPIWWTKEKRRIYTALTRYYQHNLSTDNNTVTSQNLSSCYYELGLYNKREQSLQLQGSKTHRETIKSIIFNNMDEMKVSGWVYRSLNSIKNKSNVYSSFDW